MVRLGFLVVAALVGCERTPLDGDGGAVGGDGGGGGGEQPTPAELYSSAYSSVVLEVDYQTGAEPFTGEVVGFGDTWTIFTTNAERLFMGSSKTLDLPTTLGDMEELTDLGFDQDFATEEILAIAEAHRDQRSAAPTATFYALWVDGYWNDGGERRTDVLGVSFGGTGVIAMFKPVIETATVLSLPNATRFAEQAILVHEFGHAVGLVANGIPLASDHHDTAHGAHCTNDRCVMFFAYEGASDLAMFVRDYVTSSDVILFAQDCLADIDAMIAGG